LESLFPFAFRQDLAFTLGGKNEAASQWRKTVAFKPYCKICQSWHTEQEGHKIDCEWNDAIEEAAKIAENWPDEIEGRGIAYKILKLKRTELTKMRHQKINITKEK
jgi:hypothetical protein